MLKFKATAVVKILFNYYCRARSLKEILTERIQRKKKHGSRSPNQKKSPRRKVSPSLNKTELKRPETF